MLTSIQQMRERFFEEYDRLNPGQKEAVDAIEGPGDGDCRSGYG